MNKIFGYEILRIAKLVPRHGELLPTGTAMKPLKITGDWIVVLGVFSWMNTWYIPIVANQPEQKSTVVLSLPCAAASDMERSNEPRRGHKETARRILREETGFLLENSCHVGFVQQEKTCSFTVSVFVGTIDTSGRRSPKAKKDPHQEMVLFPLKEWVDSMRIPGRLPEGFVPDHFAATATVMAIPRLILLGAQSAEVPKSAR